MVYPLPPNEKTGRPHEAPEAFCLMKYASEDGTETELIWNSRDGVTPFGIALRSGKHASHVEWEKDQYLPNHIPNIGDRIFADLSPQVALEQAKRAVEAHRKYTEAHPESASAAIPVATVEDVAFHMIAQFWPHSPMVVEVTEEMRTRLVEDVVRLARSRGMPPSGRHG